MKETRTINISGRVFYVDNDAYLALNDYLQDIELRIPSAEKDKTMTNLENRACELLQSDLFARNIQVVDMAMINDLKAHMGDPSNLKDGKHLFAKRTALSQRRGCVRVLKIALLVSLIFMVTPILIPFMATIFGVLIGFLGIGVGSIGFLPLLGVPFLVDFSWWQALLVVISALVAVFLPIGVIIYSIVMYVRSRKSPKSRFWIISLIIWLLGLLTLTLAAVKETKNVGGIDQLFVQLGRLGSLDERRTDAALLVNLPAINAVNASGAIKVDILQGERPSLVLNDSMLMNYSVQDSVLTLSATNINGYRHATVIVKDLNALNISGASDVDIKGNFNKIHFTVSGASKLDAEDAPTEIVYINCLGASKAEVYATQELWAQAAGSSKISYKGDPIVKRSMSVGASKIKKD